MVHGITEQCESTIMVDYNQSSKPNNYGADAGTRDDIWIIDSSLEGDNSGGQT